MDRYDVQFEDAHKILFFFVKKTSFLYDFLLPRARDFIIHRETLYSDAFCKALNYPMHYKKRFIARWLILNTFPVRDTVPFKFDKKG